MGGLKHIKRRLVSVKSTKKITGAMKLVSAAKLKKAQDAVLNSRQYSDSLKAMLQQIIISTQNKLDISHPLMQSRESVKKVRLIVIGGNRGLCGAYNSNINKLIEQVMRERRLKNPDIQFETVILGRKPAEYYRRISRPALETFETLTEDPNTWPLTDMCLTAQKDFIDGKIDEVAIIFTKFRSAISSKVEVEQLLPFNFNGQQGTEESNLSVGDVIFEPSAQAVFNGLIPRLVRTRILQAALESKASEHGSRMAAMDSASKNAGELTKGLQLVYNRVRQSGITSQLLDIVGGAEALKS